MEKLDIRSRVDESKFYGAGDATDRMAFIRQTRAEGGRTYWVLLTLPEIVDMKPYEPEAFSLVDAVEDQFDYYKGCGCYSTPTGGNIYEFDTVEELFQWVANG